MTKAETAKRIFETAHITGTFTLRSGQVSNEYFDKYLFEAQPDLLAAIVTEMRALLPEGTQVLAGLETGGIPLCTILSAQTGIPAAFVRKKAKEYGTDPFLHHIVVHHKAVADVRYLLLHCLKAAGPVNSDAVLVMAVHRQPHGPERQAFAQPRQKGEGLTGVALAAVGRQQVQLA